MEKRELIEYLAFIFRTATVDYKNMSHKNKTPDMIDQQEWIILAPACDPECDFDDILGFTIYASTDSCSLSLAIPADQENNRQYQKLFNELIQQYSFEWFVDGGMVGLCTD